MKSKFFKTGLILMSSLALGATIIPSSIVLADSIENNSETVINSELEQITDTNELENIILDNVKIEDSTDGPVIIVYEDGAKDEDISFSQYSRAAKQTYVSKWGKWQYTNIAISTGVLAGAINTALYSGVGVVAGIIGLPALAVGGLLTASQWTKLGNAPGAAVAKQWDKNKNGWVGFYMSKGYNAAGKHVATKYSTK